MKHIQIHACQSRATADLSQNYYQIAQNTPFRLFKVVQVSPVNPGTDLL